MAAATVPVTKPAALSPAPRRALTIVAVVVAIVVVGGAAGANVPSWLDLHVQEWAQDTYKWTILNRDTHWLFTAVFEPISSAIDWAVEAVLWILENLRWPGVLALAAMVGWRTGGVTAAFSGTVALALPGILGVWDPMMVTLSLMIVAVVIAFLVGVPLGVWTARSDRADRVLRGVLDTAQVLPTFVYLIPLVVMFGIQSPPAVIATVVYAIPPAVRLTNLGLRSVPVVANEVAESFGCTRRQQLFKVQLPMARRTILLGLNQVIMMAFGIVVIASLVGTGDAGLLVLKGLQKSDVGEAFVPGLAIVAAAIALDRITTGERRATGRSRWRATAPEGRGAALAGLGVVATAIVIARLTGSRTFPESWTVDIVDPVNDVVQWTRDNLRTGVPIIGGTQSINDFLVTEVLDPAKEFLTWLPWLAVVGAFGVLGWVSKGWRLGLTCALAMMAIAGMGSVPGTGRDQPVWDLAMDTLSQVLVAIVIAVIIAVPLGVVAGRSSLVNAFLRPILDTAQVMPQFVYLIPVVALFLPGRVCGVVAAVIYAVPPCIRLTSLGLREVPATPREAAVSFGATPRQELLKVQLPMAFRSIMLGINQTVLMVLATVIIAALVGAGALGLEAYRGFAKPSSDIGRGLAGGLSIVLLAVVLDRVTQAWGTRSRR